MSENAEYKIVSTTTEHDLERSVIWHLRDGWSLCGGMAVVYLPSGTLKFYQAVARRVDR